MRTRKKTMTSSEQEWMHSVLKEFGGLFGTNEPYSKKSHHGKRQVIAEEIALAYSAVLRARAELNNAEALLKDWKTTYQACETNENTRDN